MGTSKEDNIRTKLLDLLAEEPTMVLSTAYAYAKNYVLYGDDITKAWTTAVQQAAVIQEVRLKAWMEAYDSFKKDYEKRLKVDLEAILVELQLEIEELEKPHCHNASHANGCVSKWRVEGVIQQKINSLKENIDGK